MPTRIADARVTTTPNAVMTTLASPTQGGSSALSMWRVAMDGGQAGPVHRFDVEQVWHLLDGTATVMIDGEVTNLDAGDTLVLAAGLPRQIRTTSGALFIVSGDAAGKATPVTDDGAAEPVSPAWML